MAGTAVGTTRATHPFMPVLHLGVTFVALLMAFPSVLFAQHVPQELPAAAGAQLVRSLAAASGHGHHLWRDVRPMNPDATVNGYIEIARGDRRKYELDMRLNARVITRLIPEDPGGYPVNYGFVPQTISYDGDPFDVLVLGPALPAGAIVRGAIVGLMHMEDEKGLDSKVVLSPLSTDGRPRYDLTPQIRDEIAGYFRRYKQHDGPGTFSKVPGWGSIAEGRDFITTTHAFFRECRTVSGAICRLTSLTLEVQR